VFFFFFKCVINGENILNNFMFNRVIVLQNKYRRPTLLYSICYAFTDPISNTFF